MNLRSRISLVVGLCAACTSAGETQVVHEAYDGAAPFPSTRAPVVYPDGDFALVPSSSADRLTLYDLEARRAVVDAPVGRNPGSVDGAHQVVGDRARGVAYVVLSYPGSAETAGQHAHGTSGQPGYLQKIALDDLRPLGEVRLDPNPGEVAVSEDGARVVVTQFDLKLSTSGTSPDQKRATLTLVDPNAMLPFGTPEPDKLLTCVAPHGVVLSRPDGARAFVACYGEDALAIVDTTDIHAPVVRVPVGASPGEPGAPRYGPYALALSPSGKRLAIANRDAKELRFYDVESGVLSPLVVALDGAPGTPAWAPDESRVWVPTQAHDALVAIDAATGNAKIGFSPDCAAPIEAALGGAGVVYVVCEGTSSAPGAIAAYDAQTLESRGVVSAGSFPGRPMFGRGR